MSSAATGGAGSRSYSSDPRKRPATFAPLFLSRLMRVQEWLMSQSRYLRLTHQLQAMTRLRQNHRGAYACDITAATYKLTFSAVCYSTHGSCKARRSWRLGTCLSSHSRRHRSSRGATRSRASGRPKSDWLCLDELTAVRIGSPALLKNRPGCSRATQSWSGC